MGNGQPVKKVLFDRPEIEAVNDPVSLIVIEYKSQMVVTLKKTDIKFNRKAMLPNGIRQNNLPIIEKRGYPLGCGIPREKAAVVNSPLSPKYTVGQIVVK